MKYIDTSYKIIEQQPGIQGMYKQIELAGRTCYKSENNITEDSAEKFVKMMIKSGHLAMLEHGTCYLQFKKSNNAEEDYYNNDPYDVRLNLSLSPYTRYGIDYNNTGYSYYTTNLRVIVELLPDDWEDFLKKHWCEPTEYHEKRVTVKFNCDRFTGESFLRHRVFSFARESTRYCNYSKDKFNNEITFIEPFWSKNDKAAHEQMTSALKYAETYYFFLLNEGWKPEQARVVLPCAILSPLVMTGFVSDWKHFFDLRAKGTTGKPHPQAKELAEPLMNEFISRKWLEQ